LCVQEHLIPLELLPARLNNPKERTNSMNIMFSFTDSDKNEKYHIVAWKEYNSPFLPCIGDRVWIAVFKGEERNNERKYCKVTERFFYPDGDVFMEVLWED